MVLECVEEWLSFLRYTDDIKNASNSYLKYNNEIFIPDSIIEVGNKKIMFEYKVTNNIDYNSLSNNYNDKLCERLGVDRIVIIIFWLEDNQLSLMPNHLDSISKLSDNKLVDIIGIRTKI